MDSFIVEALTDSNFNCSDKCNFILTEQEMKELIVSEDHLRNFLAPLDIDTLPRYVYFYRTPISVTFSVNPLSKLIHKEKYSNV